MYIKRLELKNFKVVSDFNADFEGNIYFITGENERGKSTILDSIGVLLTGEPGSYIKKGEQKGFAKMVVGNDNENYEVELKFTEKNPRGTLTITSQSTGMKSDSISMLQKIFGYTDFDAVEFASWSETAEGRRKQIEVVKSLLPADVQKRISEIDAEVLETKDLRKDSNSKLKAVSSLFSEIEKKLKPEDIKAYAKPIEVSELMEKQRENVELIEKAKGIKARIEERGQKLSKIPETIKGVLEAYETEVSETNADIERLKIEYDEKLKGLKDKLTRLSDQKDSRINDIEAEKADLQEKDKKANEWMSEYEKQAPEKSNLNDEIQKAQEHNAKHNEVLSYLEKKKQKDQAQKEFDKLDKKASDLLKERETIISKSQLPIDGLTFTDDGLELNGIPFEKNGVSDSQIMEVAAKLIIAKNPTVKVFRIARGESLGGKRLQDIIDIAKRNNFQGFIEEVKRGQDDLIIEEYSEA